MSARSNNIKGRRLIGSLATVLALAGTAAGCGPEFWFRRVMTSQTL